MLGVGPQELLIIGLLLIVVFGPLKAAGMARDLGSFVKGASHTVVEFKEEILTEEVKEVRSSVDALKSESVSSEGHSGPDKNHL